MEMSDDEMNETVVVMQCQESVLVEWKMRVSGVF
jgi:hypothetical protein